MMRRVVGLVIGVIGVTATAAIADQDQDRWQVAVPAAVEAPRIDGRIDEGEWRGAAVLDDFRQVEPGEGEPVSERTSILLMVDRDHIYIALRCFDSDPSAILGSQVTRDARLDPDDRVEIVIDTFHDRRNAYFFQIGPGGSKGDALIANNGGFFSKDWDGVWRGRAAVHESGWSAELAIPAKTLSLEPGLDRWGFNAKRHIKRKNEEAQWAYPDRRHRLFEVSSSGTVTGVSVLDPGIGLDVVPYAVLRSARERDSEGNDLDGQTEIEPGLDVRYRLTSGLAATLTANTDFAQTEVDDRVVSLSRFPVFFPEKRDFFLEDSGIFTFGPFGGRGRNSLLPFFSRRIGLSAEGEAVPILVGAKLTGRQGRFNLGLLDVLTDAHAGVGEKNLLVGRVSANVGEESQVGAIFTDGDPSTPGDNTLVGLDLSYSTSRLREDHNLRVDIYALASRDRPAGEQEDDGHTFGILARYPNDFVDAEIGFSEISDGFAPDLGFVRRTGMRRFHGELELRPRPSRGAVRRYSFKLQPEVFTALTDGEVDSSSMELGVEVLFHSGDQIEMSWGPLEERLGEPFEIHDQVVIEPGVYRFDRWSVELESADKRRFSGTIGIEGGDFFDGERTELELELAIRPIPGFAVEALWEQNEVDLPSGSFTTHLARARLVVDFGPDLSWITVGQWDDVDDAISINSRLRWILEPGRDLFFVVDHGQAKTGGEGFAETGSAITLKSVYTFRF